jgi:predicted transposase/invertase (TIGR01784 family)
MSEVAPNIEKYLSRIKQMRLLDDDLMRAALNDNIEGVEDILQIVMDKKDLTVKETVIQEDMKNLYGRSLCLDVYAIDSTGKVYDVEIQRSDKGAGAKRARYHQSIMDANNLQPKDDVEKLPETYVIFFTENDVLGAGEPIYHIERVIQETGALFMDGEHILYVNGAYQGEDSALGILIADFRQTDPDKIRTKSLADRVRYLKESEEGVNHMCRIMEELIQDERRAALEEGIEQGIEQGLEQGREEGANLFKQVLTRLKRGDNREDIMRELSVSEKMVQEAETLLG